MRVFRRRALKLNGEGYIHYELRVEDHSVEIKMTGNDESGSFSDEPISLKDIARILDIKQDFVTKDFDSLFNDAGNNNNKGFLVAILIDLRLLEKQTNSYVRNFNYQERLAQLYCGNLEQL